MVLSKVIPAAPILLTLITTRGLSDFDKRHRLVVSEDSASRLTNSNYLIRNVLGGWQSNVIFTAESGSPDFSRCSAA